MLCSANAAAIADTSKSFKFLVNDPTKGQFYLADAGLGTQDESKALICELSADVLKCGGKGFESFPDYGDMLMLSTSDSASSSGWSIDANDNIQWSAKPDMKFSIGIGSDNDVWAEVCPHHWTQHGTAKAVYV